MTKINNWFVTWEKTDGYTPPEMRRKAVIGQVQGHPTQADGIEVTIVLGQKHVDIEGRVITVKRDGEQFELGEPEPGYLKFLVDNEIPYDEAMPIKMVDELKYGDLEAKRPPGGHRGRKGENG